MNFRERLEQVIRRKKSLLCVGLDTDIAKLPAALQKSDDPLFEFNKAIIDATAEFAAAFKVNLAFYEAHGLDGWRALEKTFAYLPDDVVKIADAKRGDIGNTAQMYAKALFDGLGADAVTTRRRRVFRARITAPFSSASPPIRGPRIFSIFPTATCRCFKKWHKPWQRGTAAVTAGWWSALRTRRNWLRCGNWRLTCRC